MLERAAPRRARKQGTLCGCAYNASITHARRLRSAASALGTRKICAERGRRTQRAGVAALIASLKALTAAAGPCGWSHTAAITARKSALALTSVPQFSGVIPPMAQDGTVMISFHQVRISGSLPAMRRVSLVVERKKPPKAT